MGNELADMSYRVILENSIQSFPPQRPPKAEIWINEKVRKELGFNLSDSIKVKFKIKMN